MGEAVAAVHRVSMPADEPLDPWYHDPIGADRWDELVAQLRDAGAPFADRLAELRDELVALESWIEPPQALQTCHRDLWADNVLPTPDGGVCVIDWENSGPADPNHELGCVLFEFGRDDAGRARALVDAYRAAGGPAAVTDAGDFSMLIAQLGHIAEIAATDWLEPNPRSPERADAAAWIGEVLDEPHTRDVLDRLLRCDQDDAQSGSSSDPDAWTPSSTAKTAWWSRGQRRARWSECGAATTAQGQTVTCSGEFVADPSGTVNTSRDPSVGGDYTGLDPFGLFWSVDSEAQSRLVGPASGPCAGFRGVRGPSRPRSPSLALGDRPSGAVRDVQRAGRRSAGFSLLRDPSTPRRRHPCGVGWGLGSVATSALLSAHGMVALPWPTGTIRARRQR